MTITILPVKGLPLIHEGDNLPELISERCMLEDGDIVSIASSVYSKSKGYTRRLADITPTERAQKIAKMTGEDPRFLQSILDASKDVILEYPFILSEVGGGHIGVRAGVDQSNIEDEMVILLPPDPTSAADEVRESLRKITGKDMITWIASEFRVEPKFTIVDKWMLYPLGVFVPVMREMPEMMYQYDRDYFFDSSKFTRRFGISATPYEEGVKATCEIYKK